MQVSLFQSSSTFCQVYSPCPDLLIDLGTNVGQNDVKSIYDAQGFMRVNQNQGSLSGFKSINDSHSIQTGFKKVNQSQDSQCEFKSINE